ncbi:MAG: hypothetical protein M5U22_06325 [Thermoleophilia bacterium]|nr:hypothetical protein [Thermoleophilia bacterium]
MVVLFVAVVASGFLVVPECELSVVLVRTAVLVVGGVAGNGMVDGGAAATGVLVPELPAVVGGVLFSGDFVAPVLVGAGATSVGEESSSPRVATSIVDVVVLSGSVVSALTGVGVVGDTVTVIVLPMSVCARGKALARCPPLPANSTTVIRVMTPVTRIAVRNRILAMLTFTMMRCPLSSRVCSASRMRRGRSKPELC